MNGIQSSQPQGSAQNSRQIQQSGGTQQLTSNANGQPEMTSSNSGPQMSNLMLPLDGMIFFKNFYVVDSVCLFLFFCIVAPMFNFHLHSTLCR